MLRHDPTMLMHHGTAAGPFDEFQNHLPAFFTSNRDYAEVYMTKGKGRSRIVSAYLDVSNPFVGDTVEDVDFYNDGFVPWLLAKDSPLYAGVNPIVQRQGVPFVWADDFFVHLRRTARAGTSTYDGMIVDEGGTGEAVGGHGVTLVPLWPRQIRIVSQGVSA